MVIDTNINLVDDIIASKLTSTIEFKEYCDNLDELGSIIDPEFYLEAVEHKMTGIKRQASKITKNTVDATKKAGSVYNDVTDIGGSLLKGGFDVVTASISLIVKIIKFFTDKIVKIPQMIVRLIEKIGQIPSDIKNKIKGNITLYITINDIQDLYAQSLMTHLLRFMNYAKFLSNGEMWGTFFNTRKQQVGLFEVSLNDKKILKEMEKIYSYVSKLGFSKTVIDMSDNRNVNAYFGNSKSVKFIDHKHQRIECTYYEALQKLVKDLSEKKDEIEAIRITLGNKIAVTQANQQFVKAGASFQKSIMNSVQMVSKVIEIIGNIVRYTLIDIKTIDNTTDKILAKRNIKANKKEDNKKEANNKSHYQDKDNENIIDAEYKSLT